jgi:hypothetical protein
MTAKQSVQEETEARISYIVECHRSAHEELMFRVAHRDHWLKLQLLAQATLLALAFGVEIGGIKPDAGLPSAVLLALPTSLVLACLYVVEDRLIGLISRFIGRLSDLEAKISKSSIIIEYVGTSPEIRRYAATALRVRVTAQVVAFAVVPSLLCTYRFAGVEAWQWYHQAELAFDGLVLGSVIYLLGVAYRERKLSGRADPKKPVE